MRQNLLSQLLTVGGTDYPLSNKLVLVLLRRRGHAFDLTVHDRLGETGLVDLIMSVVSIAYHVQHHVLTVLAPVLDRKPARLNHGDRVRRVHS